MADPILRRQTHVLERGYDQEIHVSWISVAGHEEEYIEIRDFIPSSGEYLRGITFPKSKRTQVMRAIGELK